MGSRVGQVLAFSGAIAALPSAVAAVQLHAISLPSEEAFKSIPEFARQVKVQIIAPVGQLHGVKTPAVQGTMETTVALAKLLVGTGLEVASNDGATIVLRRVLAAPHMEEVRGAGTAPPQGTEAIVVSGSRVIADAARSPTPLTLVTPEQLGTTTPSNLADGLNKLPVFEGSLQPRSAGNGSTAGGINVLNLRNFGANRTLVLLDGRRVPPSNADGTMDVDTLPQMLISRVDVVTGGASAVYGSDAVTGVVNFVLEKEFDGLKIDANVGASTYADGLSYKFGIAAGGDLLNGQGHFEGSLQHFQQDGVRLLYRPYGSKVYVTTGSGTAANPYLTTVNTRRSDSTFGGRISCSSCQVNGYQFAAGGVIIPFVEGTPTGTGNQQSGGDGAYNLYGNALTNVRTDEAFGRFSYAVDSNSTFYVQAIAAEQFASGWWFPTKLTASTSYPSVFFKNNPLLSASAQALLGNNGVTDASNTFVLGEYMDMGPNRLVGTRNVNRNLSVTTGIEGALFGDYRWDLYYTHGENRQAVDNLNNSNYQKLYAAEDAVVTSDGTEKCYAASQAATADAYRDCVPLNPFGQGAVTSAAYAYFTGTTWYHMTNTLDDFGGSISGEALDDWAGPVKFALSAEVRFNDYRVDSNASPAQTVDCTGLRICNASLALWAQNTVAAVHASNYVWEMSGELDVPLLKGAPFVQSLNVNVAGRYTDYSTSGAVQTWKVGLDYHVSDELRFRGATSIDIRAPTLNDLFSPVQNTVTAFVDVHTSTSGTVFMASKGNPDLVPEVARTYTMGAVVTPGSISGLAISLDYYRVRLKNAIALINGQNVPVQHLCESSAGTSQYCSLVIRLKGFSDHTAANFPVQVYSENLNTALGEVEGFDFETNYAFEMSDLAERWRGAWTVRLLANYQPVDQSQPFPGAVMTYLGPGPDPAQSWKLAKTHVTAFLRYSLGDCAVTLQDRWIGGYSKVAQTGQVWTNPHVGSTNYMDVNIERYFSVWERDFATYLTVQNIFDAQADIYPFSGSVGLLYPVAPEGDVMGRYFTLGIRANL